MVLPRYGINELDEDARQRWEALGFATCSVDMAGMLDLHGAIRCLTQVIARDPWPVSET